ncbi:hypothetical protein [Sphaerisporangium fuscum]|uniref:hypothetical protein n=1 Tax=Sphaerisporangium fuscum TaxID=2835868 RepID=UPI001BDC02FB|nr:hypothetical protein [Sphaerisporangium fuscum]
MISRVTGPFKGRSAWTLAVATAITGGVVALSFPATAQAGTETQTVPGQRVTSHVAHAPAGLAAVTSRRQVAGDDDDGHGFKKQDDDDHGFKKRCCHHNKCVKCPPQVVVRGGAVDTAFQGNNKFIGVAQGDGTTLIRDPRTTPPWHDISSLPGYPGNVTDLSLAVMGDELHVTVRSATGLVAQTSCKVNPTPGTGNNPAWPGNCTAFANLTPPL